MARDLCEADDENPDAGDALLDALSYLSSCGCMFNRVAIRGEGFRVWKYHKGAVLGKYIRNKYSEDFCNKYWKERFEDSIINTLGFEREVKNYLLWRFDLRNLCNLVNYYDKENIPQYEKFVKMIIDGKLHQKVKNCDDILDIDQEDSTSYGIDFLMARFAYAGARNRKVDRYIPIEEIRKALKEGLDNKCDVDLIIDNYQAKEDHWISDCRRLSHARVFLP